MPDKSNSPRKTCIVCGRPMTWRKKWALTWQGVKFCSDRCRKLRKKPQAEEGVA
jgi:hypothetical protein